MNGIQKIAKGIIIDELEEQSHVEAVEDVIFWALEHYSQRGNGTLGEVVASAIVSRIKEEEKLYKEQNN